MNSIDYILAKNPGRDRFVTRLFKGYEERRAVTRLVNFTMEQMRGGGKISLDASGWKAKTVVVDLNTTRADDPSCFGYIAHVFKLCFDSEYAKAFEEAVNAIGDAYATFLVYQKLSNHQAEKAMNHVLIAQKASSALELVDEITLADHRVIHNDKSFKKAYRAYSCSLLKCSGYPVWERMERANDQITKGIPDALQEFADAASYAALQAREHGRSYRQVAIDTVSTPEQRTALIEKYKQKNKPLLDAEIEVRKNAEAQLDEARTAAQASLDKLKSLQDQQDQVLQDQKTLEDRNAFLDQEIARLQALIP